jgi:hypothetical protein
MTDFDHRKMAYAIVQFVRKELGLIFGETNYDLEKLWEAIYGIENLNSEIGLELKILESLRSEFDFLDAVSNKTGYFEKNILSDNERIFQEISERVEREKSRSQSVMQPRQSTNSIRQIITKEFLPEKVAAKPSQPQPQPVPPKVDAKIEPSRPRKSSAPVPQIVDIKKLIAEGNNTLNQVKNSHAPPSPGQIIKEIKVRHYGNVQLPNGQAYCQQSPSKNFGAGAVVTPRGVLNPRKPNFNDFLQKTIDIKAHLDRSKDRSGSFMKRAKWNAKKDREAEEVAKSQ